MSLNFSGPNAQFIDFDSDFNFDRNLFADFSQ
ncbi:MAG TPA: hypothetical protein DEB17_09840 [Chlorobaculum sp.]|uniref:Uncharacterized protein n=1 Tax=Chlorobaculum tepidum (strain ATCC 49652 / DSM 12025 / NBRC 103806 / TLS) TaxID=194439 RepID=Q8KGF6_CHLTE|nr:hypothetical protein CT0012 [Chlorobaculum tepidum TLS]HBU24269.1 hypothetical protein [Chlorobaculum sp.]